MAERGRAIEIDPLSPLFGTVLAYPYFYERQYRAAVQQYRKILETDPNYAQAHLALGEALEQQGFVDAAIEEFQGRSRCRDGLHEICRRWDTHSRKSGGDRRAMMLMAELKDLESRAYC